MQDAETGDSKEAHVLESISKVVGLALEDLDLAFDDEESDDDY